jgi:hypothetical protein
LPKAVSGTAARNVIVDMRRTHYHSVLDGLGVPTWDESYAGGTHFLCSVDDVPVASVRSACVSVHSGEVVDFFPHLATTIPVTEFVYLSRQLVVPDFRGCRVVCCAHEHRCRLVVVLLLLGIRSRELSLGNALTLGGRILAPSAPLGAERELIFPMGGRLQLLAERTRTVLGRHDWKAGS